MVMYGGVPTGYMPGTFDIDRPGGAGAGAYTDIMERQRLMAPLAQYRAMLAQLNPTAGRYQQQAAMQGFNPAYSMYEAFGVPGTEATQYGSFADYLTEATAGGARSQADLLARMNLIAGARDDPTNLLGSALRETYYGGDVEEQAARRLATTEALGRFGGARANPQMQRAMSGVIDRLYGQYLGSEDYSAADPGGFMDYYLTQRGLRTTPAANGAA